MVLFTHVYPRNDSNRYTFLTILLCSPRTVRHGQRGREPHHGEQRTAGHQVRIFSLSIIYPNATDLTYRAHALAQKRPEHRQGRSDRQGGRADRRDRDAARRDERHRELARQAARQARRAGGRTEAHARPGQAAM